MLVDNIRAYEGKEPRVIDSTERKSKVVPTSVAKGYLGSAKAIMPYVSTYYTNQNKYEAKHEMILENDDTVVYVHEEELKAMFGANAVLASPHATEAGYYNILETATANKYLIESYDTRLHMFSKTPMGLPEENAKEVMRYMFSVRPTAADLLELYKKSDNYGKHPRVLIDGEDLERIKSLYKTDPLMQEWGANVIEAANKIFGQDDYTYPITTGSMDQVNYSMDDIVNLCLAYHLTGNERYVGRTWRFLKTICDLPHWNPGGYLDVGELSYIVGLGYDWLYHQFTPQQRAYIEKALYDKGVHLTYRMYFRELDNKEPEYYVGWWDSEVNWNAVCNGGTMCGAIALLDVYPEVASVMIENANRALEYMMPSYYPAGAWDEGGGYWNYALGYVVRIITTFRNAFGTDFNLAKTPGLSNTGWFGSKLAGSTGAYTFGDTAAELVTSPHMLWLANEYNDPALAGQRLYELSRTDLFVSNGGGYNEMIYYDPETVGDAPEPELDTYVEGMEAIGFREAWYDTGAAYIGATGGKAIRGHGHIDVGSFAIDMGGERFIMDPGADKYGADGYFDRRRYNFYRTRPEGHNMYVINYEYDNPNYTGVNTNTDEGYNPSCKAEILVSKPRGGIGKIDLTPLYNKWATSAVRGYMLSDHRRSVTVRDEIDLIEPNSEVIYSLHTRAKIEKVSDNQIVLDQNGKKMLITLVTNGEVQYFDEAEAKTLSNVITAPDIDNRSVGMRKIMLKLIGNGRLNISVKFKQYDDTMVADSPIDADISTWTIPDGEVVPLPEVDNIYIEGKPVEGFDSKVTGYKYLLPTLQEKAPEVTVDSRFKYEVIPAQDPEGDTLVKVYADESDEVYRVYRIDFWKKPPLADIDGMRRYPVDKITASAIPEPQNGPDNTIDGDFSTRWASQSTDIDPEQWLMYELADVYPIEKIGVAWMNGTTRRYIYKLEISTDGKNWTTVFDGQGSGTTGDCEYTYLNGQKAKYVRYKGYGSDTDGGYNRWNSIVEIEILGNQR